MFDIIILGGGPAGLTAALYARRYGLDVLLLEELYLGGQIINTHAIENYPGFSQAISGGELIDALEAQVRAYQPAIAYESVKEAGLTGPVKKIQTSQNLYESATVIIAAGQNPRPLDLPRENELKGKGVSYCATCDGNFFRGRDVAVVGGGDSALTETIYLSRLCREVTIIHRREEFRAAQAEVDKLMDAPNVTRLMNSQVTELIGDDRLEALRVRNRDGSERVLSVSGVFAAIGAVPNTALFKDSLRLDDYGYILTDETMYTGVPGVFAAGDIRRKTLRQVVTAASDGAAAAHAAMRALGK
ncbi:MAG: thioredoxin-disulfide reductase [Clostridiales bacterium]|jgi:thioredoxin reductase (NADPH)|nr:thioredoxin-disulfide reductase [Clostridiales bacterium]